MRSFLRCSVIVALASLCFAQSVFAGVGKSIDYRLQARIEPASNTLEVEVWIKNPPSSHFYLQKDLSVRQVIADGKKVTFHTNASAESLPYTTQAAAYVVEANSIQHLHITYSGQIKETINGVNMLAPQLVELALYAAWYPRFVTTEDFTFELASDLPGNFVATTNGVMDKQQNRDGRSITRWRSYKPATDIVLLASPDLRRLQGGTRDAQIELYYSRLETEDVKKKLDRLVAGMDRLSSFYGKPRVPEILRMAYSPRDGWAYSRMPLIIVPEGAAQKRKGQGYGEARFDHVSRHELAHFWWGIADAATPDDWINEGLAEYSAFRLSEEEHGSSVTDKLIEEYRQHIAQAKGSECIVETEASSDDRHVNRYEKTALMFLEARRRYGTERLDTFLRAFYSRFAGTHQATTALFLEEAEKHMGSEAAKFFREELYRKAPGSKAGR